MRFHDAQTAVKTPEERLRILTNFLGCGHPMAPIWFIGLEEAGQWKEDWERDVATYARYAQGFFHCEEGEIVRQAAEMGRRYTKVYDIMSQLVVAALAEPSLSDWKAYRNYHLFRPGGHVFQTNLYPLGKRSLREWPKRYLALFGLPSEKEYYERVRSARFRLLRRAYRTYGPSLTICFGKTAWDEFRELLGLGGADGDGVDGLPRLHVGRRADSVLLVPLDAWAEDRRRRVVSPASASWGAQGTGRAPRAAERDGLAFHPYQGQHTFELALQHGVLIAAHGP